MKIINRITIFLISVLSISSFAEISAYQPVFLDDNNLPIRLESGSGDPVFSSDGRYIIVGEKKGFSNSVQARLHRHDTLTNETISSPFFISDNDFRTSIPFPITSSGDVVIFHYLGGDENFKSNSQYSYNFSNGTFSELENTKTIIDISENGRYQLNYFDNPSRNYFILDMISGIELALPEFDDVFSEVSDNGDVIVESGTEYLKYNVINDTSFSLTQFLNEKTGLNYNVKDAWLTFEHLSDNGQYFSSNTDDGSLSFLLDTVEKKVYINDNDYTISLVWGVNNEGVIIKFDADMSGSGIKGIYDIVGGKNLFESICIESICPTDITPSVISNDSSKVIAYSEFKENNISYKAWSIASFSSTPKDSEAIEIKINPESETIDPYQSDVSKFSIDISGTDIYGLDVSCNLSSNSLSVTQANYGALFGLQNTMTLPFINDVTSVTGTEILVAPELPFSGSGSFALVDVIADFTTEDVQITCAAEISNQNGQLLQVALTPATIRIDDGVHGGSGSVSGVIEILGVTDLSGIEVVLTIDGRQVTVITDETGRFEFDGLRDGDFTISLASDNYVQSCQDAYVTEGAAVDLGSIELLAGDINVDGNINIADFTFMTARYRSNQGDADYDAKADLNKDGTINIQDLAILGSHFGSTQCNPLQ